MRVADVFVIEGRGKEIAVTLDVDPPKRIRRASDGQEWDVKGVMYFCKRSARKGDAVGLVVAMDADLVVGDEVEGVDG